MESLHYLGIESMAHMEMGHMDLYKLEVLELELVLKTEWVNTHYVQ
jgi:hypothetical protein